jgi:hypothetical protein
MMYFVRRRSCPPEKRARTTSTMHYNSIINIIKCIKIYRRRYFADDTRVDRRAVAQYYLSNGV